MLPQDITFGLFYFVVGDYLNILWIVDWWVLLGLRLKFLLLVVFGGICRVVFGVCFVFNWFVDYCFCV